MRPAEEHVPEIAEEGGPISAAIEDEPEVRHRIQAIDISLTRDGRAEAGRMAEWPDLLLGAVGVLDPEEEAVFLKALLKIIRELQERGRISPARMCITCRYFRPDVYADAERPHHCAFVDAPFGDRSLRVDCGDHEPAATAATGLS